MALGVGSVVVDILANTKGFDKGLKSATKSIGDFSRNAGRKLSSVGTLMTTRVTAPVIAGFASIIKKASDYEESINKVDVSFGEHSKTVKDWAKTSLSNFGIAEDAALEMLSLYGDMGTSMGINEKEAASMSKELAGLAGDLASFKNVGIKQAQNALTGVFTGEADALKTLGIPMLVSDLDALAESQGKSWKEMSQAEKVALRYQFVLDRTQNAQGDFAKTNDNVAGQLRILMGNVSQLAVNFGRELLPAIKQVLQFFNELLDRLQTLSSEQRQQILKWLGIAAAIAPVLLVLGKILEVIPTIGGAFKGLGGVFKLLTNPIGMIILAIIAVVGILWYLWENSESFREALMAGWEVIKAGALEIWNAIKDEVISVVEALSEALDVFLAWISEMWGKYGEEIMASVRIIWDAIVGMIKAAIKIIGGIIKFFVALLTGDWEGLWDATKQIFGGIWDFIKNIFKYIEGALKNWGANMKIIWEGIWGGIKNIFSAIFGGIWNKIKSWFDMVKNFFKNAGKNAVRIFKSVFKLKFPKIKLPHFNIKGKFSLSPPQTPYLSIDWYKNGGILNQPSLIGAGEAGKEAVVPLSGLASAAIARELTNLMQKETRQQTNIININGANQSPNEIADSVIRRLNKQVYKRNFARG